MSYESDDKMVSHPSHYNSGKYEVIDIIDEFTKYLWGTEAVCTANALKYILRWKKKNGVQDLKKAIWYLTHLIEHLEDVDMAKATEKEWGVQPDEYDGPDEHCRTCVFRFETPENDEKCINCHGRENYKPDTVFVTGESIDKEDPDPRVKSHKVTCPTTGDTITDPDSEPWNSSEELHACKTCRYNLRKRGLEPCITCDWNSNWEPKEYKVDEQSSET